MFLSYDFFYPFVQFKLTIFSKSLRFLNVVVFVKESCIN